MVHWTVSVSVYGKPRPLRMTKESLSLNSGISDPFDMRTLGSSCTTRYLLHGSPGAAPKQYICQNKMCDSSLLRKADNGPHCC